MNNIKNIIGKNYNQMFFNSGKTFSLELEKKGILVFKNFINDKGLDQIEQEAIKLKSKSFKSSSEYNVYILPYDPKFPKNSSRNRVMSTTKKCIPNDLISKNSNLNELYNSTIIKKFFCDILNVNKLYPYNDSLSSININYYNQGDGLGWHFDNSDFTITLLIKNCLKGGEYEYFNKIRYKNGKEDYEIIEKILDEKIKGQKIQSTKGDLMIFKGKESLHRVTKVIKGERILITFNYNIRKGIPLSEESRKTFFGRIN